MLSYQVPNSLEVVGATSSGVAQRCFETFPTNDQSVCSLQCCRRIPELGLGPHGTPTQDVLASSME
jgi:hypothetical protein